MDASIDLLRTRLDALRDRLRIAVIYNGDWREPGAIVNRTHNPRSSKSYLPVAQDIARALGTLGFRHVELIPDDLSMVERLRTGEFHFAWLNTAGVQGYDSVAHAASLLELAGVPYVGHRPLVAVTLDNKHVFKRELLGLSLPTAPFVVCDASQHGVDPVADPRFSLAFGNHPGPFVVKPVSGRGSIGVTFVPDRTGLAEAVRSIYSATLNHVQIEPFLPGREFCVSVCGRVVVRAGDLRREPEPFAFSALERMLDAEEPIFTSMDMRPITAERMRLLDGRDDAIRRNLINLAQRVYDEFSLRTLIRLDVRADADGSLRILEANPKPDLKRPGVAGTSLVCAGLSEHGMSYDDLILSLLADRLDFYFRHRSAAIRHIAELLA